MLEHALTKDSRQLVEVQKIEGVYNKGSHFSVFLVRHRSHAIDQAECEEFKEVELKGCGTPTVTIVENREVFVVFVLKQVSNDAK